MQLASGYKTLKKKCKKVLFWMLITARIIWGVGDASFFCIGMSYVSRLFTSEKHGRTMGVFQAVEMVGSFLGQTAGGFLAANYGPRMNFLVCTVLGVVALLMVTLIKGMQNRNDVSKPASSLVPTRKEMTKVLTGTVIAACLINLVAMTINSGLLGTILPIYATEELLLSLTQYALLVSGSTVGSIVGNLIGGFAADKIGRKKTLIFGFIMGAVSIAGILVFSTFMPLVAMMFIKGIFWGIIYAVTPAFIADAVPDEVRGIGIGTFRTFMDMGGLIGPIIMSTLVEFIGVPIGYTYSFYLGIVMILGCLLLVLKLQETVRVQ
ncbi:MAG: MFS transporter [Candidatus Bathyarchaeota archaeon]|nr:MFS transporter [Candidatus Bathyarchaeota archaeon]